MDTDTLMFIENIQINFDHTKRIHDPVNCLNWILILPRDASYNSATERRYDPAQRKHPFLLALRRWGRLARRRPQRAKSKEKRVFSQATLTIFLAIDEPSPLPKQLSIQT